MDVGPGFFTTMQIPILLGREIDERDGNGSTRVAVVNEVFVKTYFGDRNPIGRHFSLRASPKGRGDHRRGEERAATR